MDEVKSLPPYTQLPATLLGRLARDIRYRGTRVGAHLLQDALARSVRISRELASLGVVVDAIDDAARTFYERWGFVRFQEDSYRLVLPMGSIEKLVEQTDNR